MVKVSANKRRLSPQEVSPHAKIDSHSNLLFPAGYFLLPGLSLHSGYADRT
jgi:hypothetical protein